MDFLTEHYLSIKYLHILTAALSVTLFSFRFHLLIRKPEGLQQRWIRVAPHINDTLLLILAVLLCFAVQQAPLITPWLSEKVAAVVLYILAGMFTLRWVKSCRGRVIWFMIALSTFAYIATIAINKTPLIL